MTTPRPEADRFWEKVDKTDSCWIWTAGKSEGYGRFALPGPNGWRKVYAHRWSYETARGPIVEGLQIDHLCRNRRCVNPDHLEAVSQRINILRGTSPTAANASKTHCGSGHEFTPANTREDSRGRRRCRTCHRQRERAARLRRLSDQIGVER